MKERVREITVDEIPDLIIKLKEFENASCFVKVDIDYSSQRCRNLMENGAGTVFGLFDRSGEIIGGLGCLKGRELSTGIMIADETFWFVTPGRRGNGLKLFDAFEKWADDNGCPKRAMIHMVDSHPAILQKFYESNGYKLIELHYVKEV